MIKPCCALVRQDLSNEMSRGKNDSLCTSCNQHCFLPLNDIQITRLTLRQISPFYRISLNDKLNKHARKAAVRDWLAWRCNFLKGTKPTRSADVKWESPVQIVERPPGCLWYGHASLSVCVFVCVGRGRSYKSAAGFVTPTVAALFERGPALCAVGKLQQDRQLIAPVNTACVCQESI